MKSIDNVPPVLEQAASLALQFTAAPRDYLGPATPAMKEQAALGERLAAAIRALRVTAAPTAAPQVVAVERAARIESALARLLASDPTTSACSEDDLSAAVNDASAPPFVREQAAAMLAARAALAAAPVQPVAVPVGVVEPTYMTEEQGRDWAWKDVKKGVGTKGWTAGDNGNFFGFFVHGWNYRGQFEKQRFAAPAAQGDAKELTDAEICAIITPLFQNRTCSKHDIAIFRAAIAAKAAS